MPGDQKKRILPVSLKVKTESTKVKTESKKATPAPKTTVKKTKTSTSKSVKASLHVSPHASVPPSSTRTSRRKRNDSPSEVMLTQQTTPVRPAKRLAAPKIRDLKMRDKKCPTLEEITKKQEKLKANMRSAIENMNATQGDSTVTYPKVLQTQYREVANDLSNFIKCLKLNSSSPNGNYYTAQAMNESLRKGTFEAYPQMAKVKLHAEGKSENANEGEEKVLTRAQLNKRVKATEKVIDELSSMLNPKYKVGL